MPNHVKPVDVLSAAVNAGVMKSHLPILDMIFRGLFAGFFLGITASFNFQLTALTGNAVLGGLLFFAGFMMIIFYGFELVTGNMLLLPLALFAGRASKLGAVKSILIVYWSNFAGCLLAMAFFYGSFTHFGMLPGITGVKSGSYIISSATSKTIDYQKNGGLGWAACFVKGMMCNFLVSFAVLGSIVSTSTTGKVAACWFPVAMFAVLGYEHVVVNMYTTPMSMCLGSGISQGLFWGWSIAPSTLGNLLGAVVMVAVPMWVTQGHEYRQKQREEKQINDKLSESSSSEELDIEAASPTTNNEEVSFVEQAPAVFDQHNGQSAVPNTPEVRHW